jgi:hypothetical protein
MQLHKLSENELVSGYFDSCCENVVLRRVSDPESIIVY